MLGGISHPSIKHSSSNDNLERLGRLHSLPLEEGRRRVSTSALIATSTACRVPLCRNPNCTLRSHRLYGTSVQVAGRKEAISKLKGSSTSLKQELALSLWRKPINAAGVDALPCLPIEGEDSLALRPLFHHFFDVVFDRLATLFRGPAVVTEEHKKRMLPVALSNPTYCVGLVLQSHTDIVGNQRSFEETRESAYLYGKLIRAFRHEIGDLSRNFNAYGVEIALLDICILLAYDLLYDRKEFLWHHWIGMQRLVEFRGGIEAVSTALPYVIHVDRSCAVAFSRQPAFSKIRESIVEPELINARYGAKFILLNNDIRSLLSNDVLDFCKESAKLLRIWEEVHHPAMTVSDNPKPSRNAGISPVYLHNLRDRLDEQFTLMHADLTRMPLVDQCCLLAARIVEYPITWANYYQLNNYKHCIRLCQILQSMNTIVDTDWQTESARDLLRWMLFAVLVAPTKLFEGRPWAQQTLKMLIEERYAFNDWSSAESSRARSVEKMNLYGFIWCQSVLNKLFDRVWTELESHV